MTPAQQLRSGKTTLIDGHTFYPINQATVKAAAGTVAGIAIGETLYTTKGVAQVLYAKQQNYLPRFKVKLANGNSCWLGRSKLLGRTFNL